MGFGLFSKGNMELKTDKMSYAHGETINGTVSLQLKKPVSARGVSVALFAETTSTRMTPNGMQRHTVRIFNFSVPLDSEKEYGTAPYNYEFKIIVPDANAAKPPEGVLGAVAQAASFISNQSSITKWFLEAKLDIPGGFDVSKRIQLNIA